MVWYRRLLHDSTSHANRLLLHIHIHAGDNADDQELVFWDVGLQENVILQIRDKGRSTLVTSGGG